MIARWVLWLWFHMGAEAAGGELDERALRERFEQLAGPHDPMDLDPYSPTSVAHHTWPG